jgi:threonine dehydrogenase-like Zn-dependent dehydrogenase
MIALVAYGNKKVSLEEVEKPCLTNNNQALIRVKGSGICGSDHIFFDDKVTLDWVKYPVIVGHEFAGIIEKIGDCFC